MLSAAPVAAEVIDFDSPQPSLYPQTVGVYKDVDFGSAWSAAGPAGAVVETSIWFTNNTNGPYSFTRQSGAAVLESFDVYGAGAAITLTVTDDQSQSFQCVAPADAKVTCTTGWTQAATTFSVSSDNGWNFNLVLLVFASGGAPPDSQSGVNIIISGLTQPKAILAWNPNSEPDVAGYRVYRSLISGIYGAPIAEVAQPVFIDNWLMPGTYFWVVSAFDAANNESEVSNEVSKVVF